MAVPTWPFQICSRWSPPSCHYPDKMKPQDSRKWSRRQQKTFFLPTSEWMWGRNEHKKKKTKRKRKKRKMRRRKKHVRVASSTTRVKMQHRALPASLHSMFCTRFNPSWWVQYDEVKSRNWSIWFIFIRLWLSKSIENRPTFLLIRSILFERLLRSKHLCLWSEKLQGYEAWGFFCPNEHEIRWDEQRGYQHLQRINIPACYANSLVLAWLLYWEVAFFLISVTFTLIKAWFKLHSPIMTLTKSNTMRLSHPRCKSKFRSPISKSIAHVFFPWLGIWTAGKLSWHKKKRYLNFVNLLQPTRTQSLPQLLSSQRHLCPMSLSQLCLCFQMARWKKTCKGKMIPHCWSMNCVMCGSCLVDVAMPSGQQRNVEHLYVPFKKLCFHETKNKNI